MKWPAPPHRVCAFPQAGEGFIRLLEPEGLNLGADTGFGGDGKKLLPIPAGQVGYGADASFTPQDGIREAW